MWFSFLIFSKNTPRGSVFTCKQHESEAPLGVPQGAAPQQDLLVVQRVLVTAQRQRALEAIQAVVGRFAADLA